MITRSSITEIKNKLSFQTHAAHRQPHQILVVGLVQELDGLPQRDFGPREVEVVEEVDHYQFGLHQGHVFTDAASWAG